MRKRLTILLLLSTLPAMAVDGIVNVLETPLFRSPSTKSKIVQYIRKNDLIKIHNKHAPPLLYQIFEEKELSDLRDGEGDFYTTVDRSGNTAYVLKDHVKLAYKDIREFYHQEKLTHDPTDYRLAEPLPEGFPLHRNEKYKASVLAGLGESNKNSYPYPNKLQNESFGMQNHFAISYAKKIKFDISDRIYFGWLAYYQQQNNDHDLYTASSDAVFSDTQERFWQLGIGPYISYLAYRNHRFKLSLYGGITFATVQGKVGIKHTSVKTRFWRNFSGSLYKARVGAQFMLKILPKLDFALSSQLEADLPSTLKSTDFISAPTLWSSGNDKIDIGGRIGLTFLSGIVAYY